MTDELEIEQVREAQFYWVNICDDDGEQLLTIEFKQNSEGVFEHLYHDELEDAHWIRWFCNMESEEE